MLGHLLKHEFRATGRRMLPTLGVLALLGLLANLSIRVLESGMGGGLLRVVMSLFILAFFIGMTVAWIMTLVLMISRFYRNLLKDEGYLMFTLPTNSHALIWSKLIVSTVWFFATALVTGLLMVLTVLNLANLSGEDLSRLSAFLGDGLQYLHTLGVTNGSLILMLFELIVACVVTSLTTCLHFYAAMGLGQMSDNHKGMWSVLAFIGISIVFQILGTTLFSGLDNSGAVEIVVRSLDELAQTAPGLVRAYNSGLGGALLLELLQGAVLYVVTALSLEKKLNLA